MFAWSAPSGATGSPPRRSPSCEQQESSSTSRRRIARPAWLSITVDDDGETTIVVSPGANEAVGEFELPPSDAVICQQEIPDAAVIAAWEQATGMFCLNAAPARPIAVDADLTVVNRFELESLAAPDGLVALTLGAEGAVLLDDGEEIARATPPAVEVVDGTAAGDAFTACLARLTARGARQRRSAAAGVRGRRPRGLTSGAQPSLPTAAEIDAIGYCRRMRHSTISRRRSSSTATPGTTTRSPRCSRSRARRWSCSG